MGRDIVSVANRPRALSLPRLVPGRDRGEWVRDNTTGSTLA